MNIPSYVFPVVNVTAADANRLDLDPDMARLNVACAREE